MKFSSVTGNSEAEIQFRLKIDFSDSSFTLFSPDKLKFIFFPELNFLIISYIVEDVVVVLPSSKISTFLISLINIKSRSVAVIFNFDPPASNRMLESIGSVLLFSITP